MSQEIKGEDYLVDHYEDLGDVKSDFRNYNLFKLLVTLIRGERVVDVGCGAAFLLSMLKKRGKEVVGIEPSNGMRDLALQINPNVTVLAGMAENVHELIHEPVDAVLMVDVLEHIENDTEQVKKVRSILKSHGEFVFVVPAHRFLFGKRDMLMGHYRRYTKKMLVPLLTTNGFRITYMRHWNALGFLPYFLSEKILRKPLQSGLRKKVTSGTPAHAIQRLLNFWLRNVENNFDFGFGLSIIGVAEKTE